MRNWLCEIGCAKLAVAELAVAELAVAEPIWGIASEEMNIDGMTARLSTKVRTVGTKNLKHRAPTMATDAVIRSAAGSLALA